MSLTIETSQSVTPPRDKLQAMWRGFLGRCPNCGLGRMFSSYLKVNHACPSCGEELHHQRADDAPPYVTMFIVGHAVVALVLATEATLPDLSYWMQALLWCVLAVVLSLLLLPRVKGLLVGLQWSLRMHGFGAEQVSKAQSPL